MASVQDDVAVLVRAVRVVAHRGERRSRQRPQREAVLLEQGELALALAVVLPVGMAHALVEQALVVQVDAIEARDGHEQRAAERSHFIFYTTFFPS